MFLSLHFLIKSKFPTLSQFRRYSQIQRKPSDSKFSKAFEKTPKTSQVLASPKILSKFSPMVQLVTNMTPQMPSKLGKKEKVFTFSSNPKPTNKMEPKKPITTKPNMKISQSDIKEPQQTIKITNTKKANLPDLALPKEVFQNLQDCENLYCSCGKVMTDFNKLKCENCIKNEEESKIEGEMYKLNKKNQLVKYYFVIEKNELHYYLDQYLMNHLKMRVLTGCLYEDSAPILYKENKFYSFKLYWKKKVKQFAISNQQDFERWTSFIKRIVGYSNITDYYKIGSLIGKGKFSVVSSAIHKKTGKKVAVKIVQKSSLNEQDMELLFREIEILKLCQHINIIRLLDVFESKDYMYMILELLEGGDLFTYLEKRHFRLPEEKVSKIIRSLASAIGYLHSFGIVHRDLKPENIMLANTSDDLEIKVVDFGLSKIIGPGEKCIEPFGTLSYVAPEVLQQQFYGKTVDIWSLGVITYLMLSGYLPFDDEKEKEIARLNDLDKQFLSLQISLQILGILYHQKLWILLKVL